jgi:rhamnosyltransferase
LIKRKICAVVVSYNGNEKLFRTVSELSKNVDYVYVVDNGSDESSILILDKIDNLFNNVKVEKLYENKGIGHALNLGISKAKELGYIWLLTMDQDSLIDKNMIHEFIVAIKKHPNIYSLTPNIIVNNLKSTVKDSSVEYAITSGNLVNLTVFDTIGKYNEDLFIDCVDFDFSLRLRKLGFKILRVSKASMEHELGEPKDIPKIILKFYTIHSHIRRYYMARNLLYMIKNYLFSFPIFVIKLTIMQFVILMFVPFYDKEPRKSIYYIFLGIKHFFMNKFGKLVEKKNRSIL